MHQIFFILMYKNVNGYLTCSGILILSEYVFPSIFCELIYGQRECEFLSQSCVEFHSNESINVYNLCVKFGIAF